MKKFILFYLFFYINLFSYTGGVGFIFGSKVYEVKAVESENSKVNFDYKYKYGVKLINKIQLCDTIYFDFDLSFINLNLNNIDKKNSFLIKNDASFEFYPIKEISKNFYFKTGLFVNYYITDKYCSENSGFSMLAASLGVGFKKRLSKKIFLNYEIYSELLDIISFEDKTKGFIGLGGIVYLSYEEL